MKICERPVVKTKRNKAVDQITKKAWAKNWENVDVGGILEIFNYVRVKKQMEIFLRVLPKTEKILEGGCGLARVGEQRSGRAHV